MTNGIRPAIFLNTTEEEKELFRNAAYAARMPLAKFVRIAVAEKIERDGLTAEASRK